MANDQTSNTPNVGTLNASPDQFPAMRRLSWRHRRRRIPYIPQSQQADCGAATLAMVLSYFKHETNLDEVRRAVGVNQDGADALSILRGAEHYGLVGRGLSLDIPAMRHLPPGAILHWEFNHFVVFEKWTKDAIYIVDPALGRRKITLEKARRSFSGIALVFYPADGFRKKAIPRGRLMRYYRLIFRESGLLYRLILLGFLGHFLGLAGTMMTKLVIDLVIPRGDKRLLVVLLVGFLGMAILGALVGLIRMFIGMQFRTNLITRLSFGFLDYLFRLPYEFFLRRSAGDLMERVTSVDEIRQILTGHVFTAIIDGFLVIAYLVLLLVADKMMALLVGILALVNVIMMLVTRRAYRDLTAENLELQAKSSNTLVQMLAGVQTLKIAGAENMAVEQYSNTFVDSLNASLRLERTEAVVSALTGVLSTGGSLLLLGYGTLQVLNDSMSLGTMMALNTLAGQFLGPVAKLVDALLELQTMTPYFDRLEDVLSEKPEQDQHEPKSPPRFSGRIKVDNVSFRYGSSKPLAVENVSLQIESGQSVAIVGPSGSGKSTLAHLLLGLYLPTSGQILYDGHSLTQFEIRGARRQLGVVPQFPFVFGGSIRTNIALNDPRVPIPKIKSAAKLACIHDDIMAMGMGYDTPIADGGSSLSGGQRQRIAIARAIVKGPSIMLLDEATSSLDTATEQRVMANLRKLNCTRILIAHRLSTVRDADKIVVMENAHIIEVGNHDELMHRRGKYFALVVAQDPGAAAMHEVPSIAQDPGAAAMHEVPSIAPNAYGGVRGHRWQGLQPRTASPDQPTVIFLPEDQ